MRIVSWNIRFAEHIDRAVDVLTGDAALRGADVVLLQEMDRSGTAAIAAALDADHAFTSVRPHTQTGRDFGNAIVSRWPISDPVGVDLPHAAAQRGHPRRGTRAEIDVDGDALVAVSVHTETPWLPLARRAEQFAVVADDARTAADARNAPVLVGGDFNTMTGRGRAALHGHMARRALDAVSYAGPTLRAAGMRFRLDHLFVGGLVAVDAGVAGPGGASDHAPLWAELRQMG